MDNWHAKGTEFEKECKDSFVYDQYLRIKENVQESLERYNKQIQNMEMKKKMEILMFLREKVQKAEQKFLEN